MTINYCGLSITSRFIGAKTAIFDPDGKNGTAARHHKIYVTNLDADSDHCFSFDFYPSKDNPSVETGRDLLVALECAVTDAYLGSIGSIDDFVSELGYDSVPVSQIIETFDFCHDTYCKFMFLYDNEIESLEYLRDQLESEVVGVL